MKWPRDYKTLLGVFVVVAVAIVGWSYRTQPPGTTKYTVTIDQAAKTLLYLPLYIAVDDGLLSKRGVEASIITAGGDSQAFAALASGKTDFAQGDPTFVAVSHERGGPGIVIASVLDRVAFWGVAFDQKLRPFSDPKQFKGLTVVTFPRPNTAYVVQENLLSRAGLVLGKDSQIVESAFGTELGAVKAGRADIAVSIEPTVSQAIAQGGLIVFSYPDGWGPFLLTGLMTTEVFSRQHPDVVRAVVAAYDEALGLIRSDPALALRIGTKNFPEVSADVIKSAVQRMVDQNVFPAHAGVDLASWRAALQLRVQVGDLKSVSHDDLVNNAFAPTSAAQ